MFKLITTMRRGLIGLQRLHHLFERNPQDVPHGQRGHQLLGIDVSKTTIQDLTGRPQYLVDPGCMPMKELI